MYSVTLPTESKTAQNTFIVKLEAQFISNNTYLLFINNNKGQLAPLPETVGQSDAQKLLFTIRAGVLSRYPIAKQKTSITYPLLKMYI